MMNIGFLDGKQFITFTPLVSIHGESDLSRIISNYSDEVWFQELMQLMVMVMLMI
jgi:GTP cyclohydrolase I